MPDNAPIILWFRRDLRLSDHEALTAAVATGRPVIPLFILDEVAEQTGAAAKMRLGMSVGALARTLEEKGSRLILRRGKARAVIEAVIKDTGARSVWWSRLYDPASKARDTDIKAALKTKDIDARSFAGHLLFEPWDVETKDGGYYKVYSPMWRAVRGREVAGSLSAPSRIPGPDSWPASDNLHDWDMEQAMRRGAVVMAPHQTVGEAAAQGRLGSFIAHKIDGYKEERDFPAIDAGSGLSENLTYGEIAPRALWHAGTRAMDEGKAGAEHFLKEVVWREFAYHLVHHTPHIVDGNWRSEWDGFPWNMDANTPEVTTWKQGRTGVPFVDAAMRQMYVTGTMHNRARMIVASYLTKHLMTHWKVGLDWFADCLTDWDPASNAMGWQWTAGSGPDAAPYFRIFNPVTQAEKFDADGTYRKTWIAEGYDRPTKTALSYFDAVPKSWNLRPRDPYPEPVVALDVGRDRALSAYGSR